MSRPQPDIAIRSERILASARTHFVRHGIESARLGDIARDAGVAVGTIYLRYRGKEDLLAGVLRAVEDRFVAAMEAPNVVAVPWPGRLAAIFGAVIDVALDDPDIASLMILSGAAKADGWLSGGVIRAAICRQLKDGIASGRLDPGCDPEIAAAMVYGMVDGVMTSYGSELPSRRNEIVSALATATSRWFD